MKEQTSHTILSTLQYIPNIYLPLKTRENLYVVSYDIGSSNSGAAWSQVVNDLVPTIFSDQTLAPEGKHRLKVKSSILFKFEKIPKFVSVYNAYKIGDDALSTYRQFRRMKSTNIISRFYYVLFKNFKPRMLDDEEDPKIYGYCSWRNSPMKADFSTVAGGVLRLLSLETITQINKQESTLGPPKTLNQVFSVVTIPACWVERHRSKIREAAQRAGIIHSNDQPSNLFITLEPQAAALQVQYLTNNFTLARPVSFKIGSNILLFDAGGGTIDCVFYTVLKLETKKSIDFTLQQLHKPFSGPWGSMFIEKAFISWIQSLFEEWFSVFFSPDILSDLENAFIDQKERFQPTQSIEELKSIHQRSIEIPIGFLEYDYEDDSHINCLQRLRNDPRLLGGVTSEFKVTHINKSPFDFDDERGFLFRISPARLIALYEQILLDPLKKLSKLVNTLPEFQHCILVGGFTQSIILQKLLILYIPKISSKWTVVEEPNLSVVIGGVRAGLKEILQIMNTF